MQHLQHWQKLGILILVIIITLLMVMIPISIVEAQSPALSRPKSTLQEGLSDDNLSFQTILEGNDVSMKDSTGAVAPAIAVSPNGTYAVIAYYKHVSNQINNVHVKSATASDGWLTTEFVGQGLHPSVAFGPTDNIVYVVRTATDGKSIRLSSCTLSATVSPECEESNVPVTDVLGDGTIHSVGNPDVVVDSVGNIHVAWEELPSDTPYIKIKTAFSTNSGASWTVSADGISVNEVALETPQLAIEGTTLHLVVSQSDVKIGYFQANATDHAWINPKTFDTIFDVNFQYDVLANPTIAVNGSDIFLAWDGRSSKGTGIYYGLMQAISNDNGTTFSEVTYIPDGANAQANLQNPRKISASNETVPLHEEALRPSLAKSVGGYAIIWQERGIDSFGCDEAMNASSEIHHAITNVSWIANVLTDNEQEYSIAPDIAIDEDNNNQHIVFMKSEAPNCVGGGQNEYAITYRGPFVITSNDGGEDTITESGTGNLYLPIIIDQTGGTAPDLAITKIEVPANVELNTKVPIKLTIANLSSDPINHYFDIDFYQNPAPQVPGYNSSSTFNFPGDAKYWENFLAPNGESGSTVTVTHPDFVFSDYGDFEIYGVVDTTDYILNESDKTNNIIKTSVSVTCLPSEFTSGFTWSERLFNSSWTQTQPGSFANANGSLSLISDGLSTYGNNDDATNRGHYYVHLQNPITTSAGIDIIVRVTDVSTVTFSAKGGLQLRESLDPRSPKIEFNLSWNATNKQHFLQVSLRRSFGDNVGGWTDSGVVDLDSGPVWLRINREAESNTFKFYYKQQATKPVDDVDWGAPYTEATFNMSDQLYAGVFNASYWNNNYGTSTFDNFSYIDPSLCPVPVASSPEPLAPGVTQCTDLLEEPSFESVPAQKWILGSDEGVTLVASVLQAHSGLYRVVAPTFDLGFKQPYFYQRFTMPSVSASGVTDFTFNVYQKDDALGSDQSADQFFAVVATAPNPASAITDPVLIADGVHTEDYEFVNVTLPVANGINMEDYADQELYLYLYNTSNSTCGVGTCYDTEYSFDDTQLTTCTTQPPPSSITTQLSGSVTIHRFGGTGQRLPNVKVWAYAEGGELYETLTRTDGTYNFYNMPSGEYIIYSEYHVIDAHDPSQIETLATDIVVSLNGSHTGANPLIANLDLYAITP